MQRPWFNSDLRPSAVCLPTHSLSLLSSLIFTAPSSNIGLYPPSFLEVCKCFCKHLWWVNSLALYLSTPTPPHTLHAYKLHEKNAPQVQSEFKISHCLVAAQRFEKQGETFFQLLRFVIPESENYCYCPVICRSHSVAFMSSSYPLNHWVTLHMLWMGTLFYHRTKRDHSQHWYLVTGKLTKPCLQNTDQSITKPPHPSLWGGSRVQIFPLICHQSATALIHTHIHIQ